MKLDPESASPYGVGNGPIDVYITNTHARKSWFAMNTAQDMASQHMMQRLLERRSKNTVFLWTYLTHNYDIGDDIKLTEVNYRKWCGGNSQAWRDAVDDLLAMGAIEGKAKRKGRGSVYRRVI
jgi:hypothetical protein